jgi:hypothetical protein
MESALPTIETRSNDDGKTVYRVKIRLKGAPAASATFHRHTDAVRWAEKTQTETRAGRYFKSVEAKRHTAAELHVR